MGKRSLQEHGSYLPLLACDGKELKSGVLAEPSSPENAEKIHTLRP